MPFNKIIIALLASVIFASPFIASADTLSDLQAKVQQLLAQVTSLQAEIQQLQTSPAPIQVSPSQTGTSCPAFSRTLSYGASGADVSALQSYLAQQGVFTDEITGFFGTKTQAAVQAWQARSGIVAGGDPVSTGWGVFGLKSRTALMSLCTPKTATSTPQTPPQPTPNFCAVLDCAQGYHVEGPACSTSQQCVPDTVQGNQPPVVSGVDGPASLSVGESGTWTVHASVAANADQNLKYSVVWGDESVLGQLSALSGEMASAPTVAAGTFTHAYAAAGTYSPKFTVSNSAGSATAGASVQVGSGAFCPQIAVDCQVGYHVQAQSGTDSNGCPLPGMCVPDAPTQPICPQVAVDCELGYHAQAQSGTDSNGCPLIPQCTPDDHATLYVSPASGAAPLSVQFTGAIPGTSYELDFGDGSQPQLMAMSIDCAPGHPDCAKDHIMSVTGTHTYAQTGSYTAKLSGGTYSATATVTVSGAVSVANINLANALSALQSALETLESLLSH